MENNELNFDCDVCGESITTDWYRLSAYRHVGTNVMADFKYRLCKGCYPNIQRKVNRLLTEIFISILQEEMAKLKRVLQPAGSKI